MSKELTLALDWFTCPNRTIKTIIVHCTASPDDKNITVEDVRAWHKERGFSDIGYHYLVRKGGILERGRPLDKIGAHAKGYNRDSVGIAWVGTNDCQDSQMSTLIKAVKTLMLAHSIPAHEVLGHCELPGVNKTCPNLDMDAFREQLLK